MDLVSAELPARTLVVAIDPGKVTNRVLLADGERGLIGEPVSLPTLREGIDQLWHLIEDAGAPETVIAIEATGSLHLPWVAELERRLPGSTRLFAPSETHAARTQLGSRRFKDDDRDCAALVSLARQGRGRPAQNGTLDALLDAVRHRRRLIAQRRVVRQHLHHQLNALCPGLSAPVGHGRVLGLDTPTGRAALACAVDFAGRPPASRSLIARAPGRLSRANAAFWSARWRGCLAPPADAELRAERLGRDVRRWGALEADVQAVEAQISMLLSETPGQVLTTLPGVAATRAAALAVHALPISRFPTAEHLYSFTGLAPARYESATIRKARAISRQAPGERRDALMGIAWGLSQHCGPFRERDRELRARGMRPIEARVALARHACRLCHRMLQTQQPFDEERYARTRHRRGR
ncbi:MAG TPA: IS110 family transposase [Solirubrobacterales bacterium]|jgi:transposase|nr:IS110 family transposase [Solirubrobacterales bacterium]